MANHKNAEKAIRKIATRTAVNRSRVSRIKTFLKRFEALLGKKDANPADVQVAFNAAQKEVMRGVTKGVLHKNNAARKVAQMHKKVKASESR